MRIIVLFFLLAGAVPGLSQLNPVSWTFSAQKVSEQEYDLLFTARMNPGWYIYSQFTEKGGPIPTTIVFGQEEGIELVGEAKEEGESRKEGYDELFGVNVIKFGKEVAFIQRVRKSADLQEISGFVEFMTCDDERCLPPTEIDFIFSFRK